MGCLAALLSRVALLAAWILTPQVNRAFYGGIGGWLLPLLGIIFLPVTTLAYVVVYALGNGVTGGAWLWVALAFLFDVAMHSSAASANRRRVQGFKAAGRGSSA